MTYDTWGDVARAGQQFGHAVISRLHGYLPAERRRRAERSAVLAQRLRRLLDEMLHSEAPGEEDDPFYGAEAAVSEFVNADGVTEITRTYGIDERQEIEVTRALQSFRERVEEVLGYKVALDVSIGTLDMCDPDA